MRNTSKKAAKKRTPKHPQKTRPETGIVYTDRFAYAYGEADVQPSSLPGHSSTEMFPCQVFFLEYSASGLGIVDSGQFRCRFAVNWTGIDNTVIGFCKLIGKSEFSAPSERVIPNQSSDWCGNLHRISGCLSSYRLPFLYYFPEFVHEKWCVYPGDCHASVSYFIAMTGNSINSNLSVCFRKITRIVNSAKPRLLTPQWFPVLP